MHLMLFLNRFFLSAQSRVARATLLLVWSVLFLGATSARATFSICAVDPETGEVGSAGASCISGSLILSDVHPGVGVIHTQSYWRAGNQNYASQLMDQGFSPAEIIDLLVANDDQGLPGRRQYGIVDLVEGGRSAAFTGVDCLDWKGDSPGPTYSVQGNILLGPEIVDDIEAAFLNTPGPMAFKLMAALQAANVPAADTRCPTKPAISAFIRVAQPNDSENDLFLDLNVNNTSSGQNPLDLLQVLFDQWQTSASTGELEYDPATTNLFDLRMDPSPLAASASSSISFVLPDDASGFEDGSIDVELELFDALGRRVSKIAKGAYAPGKQWVQWQPSVPESGVYFVRLRVGRERQSLRVVLMP